MSKEVKDAIIAFVRETQPKMYALQNKFMKNSDVIEKMFDDQELLFFLAGERQNEVVVTEDYPIHHKTLGSAGVDMYLAKDTVIKPGEQVYLDTGYIVAPDELRADEEYQLRARSSFFKGDRKLILTNGVGTIDSDFLAPNTVKFSYFNVGKNEVKLKAGEAVGQMVKSDVCRATHPTARVKRKAGFGSTDGKDLSQEAAKVEQPTDKE